MSSTNSQQSERRASTSCLSSASSSSGMGIRNGSGLIATGKPANPWGFAMPFGNGGGLSSSKAKTNLRKFSSKKASSSSSSAMKKEESSSRKSSLKVATSSTTSTTTVKSSSQTTTTTALDCSAVSTFIRKGITEMENLTKAASTESTNEIQDKAELRKSTLVTLESAFQAVDVAVKSNLAQEEEEVVFTVKRPQSRARSYSITTNSLPEQQVS